MLGRAVMRRIILVGLPQLLRDLVLKVLDEEPRVRVVARLDNASGLEHAPVADCVVAAIDEPGLPAAFLDAVRRNPGMRLLGLRWGGRRCFIYELAPRCVSVGEFSRDILLTSVLGAGASECEAGDGLR